MRRYDAVEFIYLECYPTKGKENCLKKYKRRKLQRKQKWTQRRVFSYGELFRVIRLPITYEEACKKNKEYFFFMKRKIKEKHPNAVLFYSTELCHGFQLARYKKQWINWYFLFSGIWENVREIYGFDDFSLNGVIYDTYDCRAFFLLSRLVDRVKRIQILTKTPERWDNAIQEYYEKWGVIIEIEKNGMLRNQKNIIFDLDGKYYKKYVEWEQENIVICFGLGETEQGYLRHRIEHGNVVYGFKQSIQGQEVDEKLASILMQSKSRRIYQLTQMEEVLFGEEEIEEIILYYQWRVDELLLFRTPYHKD